MEMPLQSFICLTIFLSSKPFCCNHCLIFTQSRCTIPFTLKDAEAETKALTDFSLIGLSGSTHESKSDISLITRTRVNLTEMVLWKSNGVSEYN